MGTIETRERANKKTGSDVDRAIEVSDLVKTYGGKIRALDGLSFSVESGTVFGLLGPNGAGKSTAVKILTTLSRPDSGQAHVAGVDVVRSPDRVRRIIGCVAQKSGFDRQATGRENLMLQGHMYGMHTADLESRVSELLERFGLAEAAGRVVRTYSGGMQRRLDIAMGLIHRPRVLFLDEPTTGLDPEVRAGMWDEISLLASEEGITILLTTHYLEEADQLARRLVIVDRGRVVAEGTPEELKGAMGGDTIYVEIQDAQSGDRALRALERVAGVQDISSNGATVRARAGSGAATVPAVLAALDVDGIGVASVAVSRPSLDDVYLRYAGRDFDRADREGTR